LKTKTNEEDERMLRIFVASVALAILLWPGLAFAQCTTIQDGGLLDIANNPITTGYDDFGYNYQALMFNGRYCDFDRVVGGDYCDDDLMMKWNQAWLSNKDCDGDLYLDRHFGDGSYIGSGAWLTNHQSGKAEVNGKMRKWTYFVKIIAVTPEDVLSEGFWYDSNGIEIGPEIWGAFAVVQEVLNDPSSGAHGILYKAPAGPGLGNLE